MYLSHPQVDYNKEAQQSLYSTYAGPIGELSHLYSIWLVPFMMLGYHIHIYMQSLMS